MWEEEKLSLHTCSQGRIPEASGVGKNQSKPCWKCIKQNFKVALYMYYVIPFRLELCAHCSKTSRSSTEFQFLIPILVSQYRLLPRPFHVWRVWTQD